MKEEWRKIPNIVGYQVSSRGRVRCNIKLYSHDGSFGKWRIRKLFTGSDKRIYVDIYQGDGGKRYSVHYLVLLAFVGPRPPGMVACHYDGNCTNNSVDNLRWDTVYGNMADDARNKVAHCKAKLTREQVIEIRKLDKEGVGTKILSERFGVHISNIYYITSGKTWKHLL